MRYDGKLGILVFFVAVVVLLSTSLFITPLSINDTDPSTYVIVPTLMLPLFVLFSLKAGPDPHAGRRDVVIGSVMFAAFILSVMVLRVYFSFLFLSFRIDLLVLPLALASLAVMLFGARNLGKFRGVILYALLASPPVLLLLLNSYNSFTSLNTAIVYGLLRPFVSGIKYLAPITISANGYYIGIGQACVSLGIFVALALFLVPIAYLYDGRDSRKAAWVISGVALLFAFNIVRMLFVSYAWLTQGPSSIIALIHATAGVILFYVAIVAMVLAAGAYGLTLGMKGKAPRRGRRKQEGAGMWPAAVALAFSLIYAYATLGYAGTTIFSPISLSNGVSFNFSNAGIARSVTGILSGKNFTYEEMMGQDGSFVFFNLANGTVNATAPVVLLVARPNAAILSDIESNGTVAGEFRFLNFNGASEDVLDVLSNGAEFFVYRTSLPLVLGNTSSSTAEVYVIMPSGVVHRSACVASYDPLYAVALNALNVESYSQAARDNALKALCISDSIVWSR
jgi:exosortase/archaeosortase family protein